LLKTCLNLKIHDTYKVAVFVKRSFHLQRWFIAVCWFSLFYEIKPKIKSKTITTFEINYSQISIILGTCYYCLHLKQTTEDLLGQKANPPVISTKHTYTVNVAVNDIFTNHDWKLVRTKYTVRVIVPWLLLHRAALYIKIMGL
jgi:hypothetical protein